MTDDLALALRLADSADAISAARFATAGLRVDTKPDRTLVTEADLAVEEAMRDLLSRERPGHGVVGEEFGSGGDSEWRWYLDPIDGTANYARGVPVWATLIALRHHDDPVCAVVSAPALHRRWWAVRGQGAHSREAGRLYVSAVAALDEAYLSTNDARDFESLGLAEGFRAVCARAREVRAFGDFWSHMLVAEGACDVSAEPEVSLWDLAAIQIIVTEAGGRFSSLEGEATPEGGSVVCTNGHLHDEVLAQLGSAGPGRS